MSWRNAVSLPAASVVREWGTPARTARKVAWIGRGRGCGRPVRRISICHDVAAHVYDLLLWSLRVLGIDCFLGAYFYVVIYWLSLSFNVLWILNAYSIFLQYVSYPDMPQNSVGKKTKEDEGTKRKPPVKISPWTLARLNTEEVSKAAAKAKKKSKVLQPITRHREVPKPDKSRVLLPEQSPDACGRTSASGTDSNLSDMAMETPGSLAPLQHEARSVFQPSIASSIRNLNLTSSPESSLDSPDLHPFRVSMSGADELRSFMSLAASASTAQKSIALSRSTSGGYEASGGEDSDRIPSRIVHRSSNWTNVILNSGRREMASDLRIPSSGGLPPN